MLPSLWDRGAVEVGHLKAIPYNAKWGGGESSNPDDRKGRPCNRPTPFFCSVIKAWGVGLSRSRSVVLTIIILWAISPACHAKEPIRTIEGIDTKVSDGDTINVRDSLGTLVKVRLYGIDAPETGKANKNTGQVSKPGQPYGEEAFQALQMKILRRSVKVDILAVDLYKRSVGIVYLNGKNINLEMVAEGHAWAYRQYLHRPHASEYLQAEEEARGKRLGIWQQSNPQAPWEFRRSLKKINYLGQY